MPKINDLALRFFTKLNYYLTNIPNIRSQNEVIQSSCELFEEVLKNSNMEPDSYIDLMNTLLKPYYEVIALDSNQTDQLDRLNRAISDSENGYLRTAFHALNLFNHYALKAPPEPQKEESIPLCIPEIEEEPFGFTIIDL